MWLSPCRELVVRFFRVTSSYWIRSVRICYAMSGTDLAYAPTSFLICTSILRNVGEITPGAYAMPVPDIT
eukprot:1437085-Rhodomonas_salina.1